MSIQDLGALGELVAAMATVATLLYLASQIRQNTRASSVEAKLATTAMLVGFTDMLIADPELNALLIRARNSTSDLSDVERQQFSNMVLKTLWFGSAGHYQLTIGTLTDEDWYELESILKFWFEGVGVREWWQRFGHLRFAGAYCDYIDELVLMSEKDSNKREDA